MPDTDPLPEELAERRDLQQCLQKAIQTLPPKFRSVVLLRYAGQLSFSEIGQALDMPEATAKTYFQRAKPLLRAALTA
jgi:RNA polymerase sigma-70 factor (ECF subfamily)